jgi:hypothetical protein
LGSYEVIWVVREVFWVVLRTGDVVRPAVEARQAGHAVVVRGRYGFLALEVVVRQRASRAVLGQVVRPRPGASSPTDSRPLH